MADASTDTETDTGEPDWGDTTPCENAPGQDEVCIPGGRYLMGCVPGDTECEDSERPLVMVTLSPFFIDKYEATIEKVVPFINQMKNQPGMQTYPCTLRDSDNNQFWGLVYHNDLCPIQQNGEGEYEFNPEVTAVENDENCASLGGEEAVAGGFSWAAAKAYCEWRGMRLPTEAQWEAAARGQTMNEYPCGSDIPPCWWGYTDCQYECNWMFQANCCYPLSPEEAGEKCPSPFGVNGMYGNAGEWTADEAGADHSWCADGCTDPEPVSVEYTDEHIFKGGDVASLAHQTRISNRSVSLYGGGRTGVRCVRPDEPLPDTDAGMDGGK